MKDEHRGGTGRREAVPGSPEGPASQAGWPGVEMGGPSLAGEMRRHWEDFAREDPMYYIATSRKDWTVGAFFDSGREIVEETLGWAGAGLRTARMLEIGCGLGRTAAHFARSFDRVDAIDVSPRMIASARSLASCPNVHFEVAGGADLSPFAAGIFDFVFSHLVFQHVPQEEVIRTYLHEIARVLLPGGLAALQFDSRPEGIASRLYKSLPDFLLPRTHRRFIRRYRRDAAWLRKTAGEAGLTIRDERGPGTDHHFLLLEKLE